MANCNNYRLREAFTYNEKSLQTRLEHALFPNHPVAKGDVAEEAWRDFLRCFLPSRYKVGSGFVIDSRNNSSQQIDCLIYDDYYTPIIWGQNSYLHIPVEAVYAAFEIKPEVNSQYLLAASEKIVSVRNLYRTSVSYTGDGQEKEPKPLFHIIGGLLAKKVMWEETGRLESRYFKKKMKQFQNKKGCIDCIDIVLTAYDGFIDYFRTGFPCEALPKVDKDPGAAIRGFFHLIRALTKQGTVSAIDLEAYEK